MTSRAPAVVPPAPARPPPIFGFALYVMGTGVLVMGLAQLLLFAMFHRIDWNMSVAVRWGMPVGQLMTALGLAIAWRTTKGSDRRLASVAGALWVTLFVLDLERGRLRSFLVDTVPQASNAAYVATWSGWAIALGLVSFVVFRSGRAFAARTWATLLGTVLVTAHAFEQAWPILVPLRRGHAWSASSLVPGLVVLGGLGLVVFAGGLYAAGRSILGGVTLEEKVGASSRPKRERAGELAERDASMAALRRGLPLLIDASVSACGLVAALATAVMFGSFLHMSARDLTDTAVLGGQLLASALLVLAVRRLGHLGHLGARLAVCAYGALVALLGCAVLLAASRRYGSQTAHDVLLYATCVPPLLVACTLWLTAIGLAGVAVRTGAMQGLRSRLRAAAVSLAASALAGLAAAHTPDPSGRYALQVIAVLGGALALISTLGAAGEARRLELELASA